VKIDFSMPVIIVKDIQISKKFYQELFDLEIREDFGENISFTCGLGLWERNKANEIIFGEDKGSLPKEPPLDTELYFETDDMDVMVKRINSSGAELIHSMKEESWGQRNIRFFDPDGFIIEVAEPISVFIKRMKEEGLSIEEVTKKSQMSLETVKGILLAK
jgi:predicted enzyme related to lactoylglutathione lyase